MVTIPIYPPRSGEITDALIEHMFSKNSILECMMMDQDSAFMFTFINYLFKKLGITIKTVAQYNHQFLQVEYRIKPLVTLFMSHLTELVQYSSKYLTFAMYSYNTFVIQI